MKCTLLIALLFFFSGIFAQQKSPVSKLQAQLNNYYKSYPCEKIYLFTDKDTYKPGNIIWFRAAVLNSNLAFSPGKTDLVVRLYSAEGTLVSGDKYQVENGVLYSDLDVPATASGGNYFLVAYSPQQFNIDEVFVKPLKIDPLFDNSVVVETENFRPVLKSGENTDIAVKIKDLAGKAEKNYTLKYQISTGADVLAEGKLKTNELGKAMIRYPVPAQSNGYPFVVKISDSKQTWSKQLVLQTNLDLIQVRFYPEGGSLVAGVPVKIGFTASNLLGIPVEVDGKIIDREGNQIAITKTIVNGCGLFPFVAEAGEKYKLVLTSDMGKGQSVELPDANPNGLAFSIVKTDSAYVSANLIFGDKKKHDVAIMALCGSNIYWAADITVDAQSRVKIPVADLPDGLCLLSVFSNEGFPLANRIIYLQKSDDLKLTVDPGKEQYKPGENINLKIKLSSGDKPVPGILAVSVSDGFFQGNRAPEIFEQLKVNAALGRPVFDPLGSGEFDDLKNPVFDYLLLANKPIGLDWAKVQLFNPQVQTRAKSNEIGVWGTVLDRDGNPVPGAKVSLVNKKSLKLATQTTDFEGIFCFPEVNPGNIADYSAQAEATDGKQALKIIFDKSFDQKLRDWVVARASQLSDQNWALDDYYSLNPALFGKPVKQVVQNNTKDSYKKLLNNSTNILDIIKVIKPYQIMSNQIVFYGSQNSLNYQGGALLVVDGQQVGTDVSAISNISPTEVDHINVSTSPIDIQRYTGLNSVGLVEIFTKRGPEIKERESKEEETAVSYNGEYRLPRKFVVPEKTGDNDRRTTLYWNPDIQVTDTGQAELYFPASQVQSDFLIKVEAITPDGRVKSRVKKITVSK